MLAAVLGVLLSCGAQTVGDGAPPPRWRPVHRECCLCWLRSLPYSQSFYSQNGYDFRRERNIPWAVRANYSLPIGVAADTRALADEIEPTVDSPSPQTAPLPPELKTPKPIRPGVTGSE